MSAAVSRNVIKQGIIGLFVADSVSMPVHWYYDVTKIKEDFNGWIAKYEAPKDIHPGVKSLSRPGPVTYEGKKIYIVGDVILKDKAAAYSPDNKATHYHQGMKAGDNTLNCYTALLAMRTLRTIDDSTSKEELAKQFFSSYVEALTTAGGQTHPDTFAESHHRAFFSDWVLAGSPTDPDVLFKFATDRATKNYANPSADQPPYIGSFTMPIPVILHYIDKPLNEVIDIAKELFMRTHSRKEIADAMTSYIRVLYALAHGGSLKDEAEKAFIDYLGSDGKSKLEKFDKMVANAGPDKLSALQDIAKELGLSCPVQSAYPVMLYLARHFHDDFEGGILANANVGGDNCARAPPLGALLGAALGVKGETIPSKWTDPLLLKPVVDEVLPF